MKIEIKRAERMTLQAFAEKHGLTMRVVERENHPDPMMRYYASFKGAETKDGRILCGEHGNGASPALAVVRYAKEISGKLLVIDADKKTRCEIRVPELTSDPEWRPE